jgi:hypothetical protein
MDDVYREVAVLEECRDIHSDCAGAIHNKHELRRQRVSVAPQEHLKTIQGDK